MVGGGGVARGESPAAAVAVLDGPGQGVVAGALADVERALVRAGLGAGQLVRASEGEVAGQLGRVDGLRLGLERVTLALATEAASRGLHVDSGLSLHDWLGQRCPWLSRSEIGDLVVLSSQLGREAHAPFRDALGKGELPVRRAAKALRALERVRAACDPETYDADVQTLLDAASRTEFTDADLGKVTDTLIDAALPEREKNQQEAAVRECRGVHESSLADGSLVRFVATCDPEGAALFRQIFASPLAAPAPDADGPDPRTATQRRYDALLTVLGRGVGAPKGSPGTAKATLMLLVALDDLAGMLLTGSGHSLTGEQLSPATVRKLACSADLVPAILGKDGELLETVRPTRYATQTQLLALWRRDRHCTFPGCTVPPQWCEAHHVTWWSRGGATYLLNLALLCGRHHTIVHDRDLTATITAHGTTWHT